MAQGKQARSQKGACSQEDYRGASGSAGSQGKQGRSQNAGRSIEAAPRMPAACKLARPPLALRAPMPCYVHVRKRGKRGKRKCRRDRGRGLEEPRQRAQEEMSTETSSQTSEMSARNVEMSLSHRLHALLALVD